MDKKEYKNLVKEYTPKEAKGKNALLAFFFGGLIGLMGEGTALILETTLGMEMVEAYCWVCVIVIFISCLFTALGFFDHWVTYAKAGLFLPTTGFAHSVTSAALDYRRDGFITGLGSSFFKLAGSVILYGILSAFFFCVIGVIIYG